eukprot:325101-Pleurochrysis_carterae.AAC.1
MRKGVTSESVCLSSLLALAVGEGTGKVYVAMTQKRQHSGLVATDDQVATDVGASSTYPCAPTSRTSSATSSK